MNNAPRGLAIIDAQRGFMPESEGTRLGLKGFGELGVTGGEAIVSPINELTFAFAAQAMNTIAATQDYHPKETAHISDTPNYVTTWPAHCIAGTEGAELHPDLLIAQQPELATRFLKGEEPCATPEDDDSYTGALAYNHDLDTSLPEYFRNKGIRHIYVAGLALGDGNEHPLCVDSTARDLHHLGFEVSLVTDATEAVDPRNRSTCFANMAKLGIRLVTSEQVIAELKAV